MKRIWLSVYHCSSTLEPHFVMPYALVLRPMQKSYCYSREKDKLLRKFCSVFPRSYEAKEWSFNSGMLSSVHFPHTSKSKS